MRALLRNEIYRLFVECFGKESKHSYSEGFSIANNLKFSPISGVEFEVNNQQNTLVMFQVKLEGNNEGFLTVICDKLEYRNSMETVVYHKVIDTMFSDSSGMVINNITPSNLVSALENPYVYGRVEGTKDIYKIRHLPKVANIAKNGVKTIHEMDDDESSIKTVRPRSIKYAKRDTEVVPEDEIDEAIRKMSRLQVKMYYPQYLHKWDKMNRSEDYIVGIKKTSEKKNKKRSNKSSNKKAVKNVSKAA